MSVIGKSPFLAIGKAAAAQAARPGGLISLAMGEPDFSAPELARKAAISAIEEGRTRYTAMDGMPSLRDAVRTKLRVRNGLDYSDQQITVTCGGTQIIFNTMMALLNEGDEVILPAPFFTPYESAIRFAGGTPVIFQCQGHDGFRPQVDQLRLAMSDRTKLIVLNSPANPSGAVLRRSDYEEIARLVRERPDILILSDDIYEEFVLEGAPFLNIVNVAPDLKDRTLLLNGVSKSYGMTGWRIGYAAGPEWIVEAIAQIAAISTFTPNASSQAAVAAVLSVDTLDFDAIRRRYRQRRDILLETLSAVDGLSVLPPEGSFYAFPSCAALLGRRTPAGKLITSDTDLALYAIESEGVATMPGSAFGSPGHIRLSFASGEETVIEGARRLVRACSKLI